MPPIRPERRLAVATATTVGRDLDGGPDQRRAWARVRRMSRVLQLSVAGFYACFQRPERWRAVIDDVLMAHLRIAFVDSGETSGAPQVTLAAPPGRGGRGVARG